MSTAKCQQFVYFLYDSKDKEDGQVDRGSDIISAQFRCTHTHF